MPTTIQDERGGLPSASSMERIMLCVGSFQMERRLKDTGNRSAADRGTRIHAAMEGTIPMKNLNHSERICAERMGFEEGRLVERYGFEGAHKYMEQRLWLMPDAKLLSGKPDVVYWDVLGLKALVINYKTGHYLPTPIKDNVQMQTEATLFAAQHGFLIPEVTAALIHPNAPLEDGGISQAHTFTHGELRNFAEDLSAAASEAMNPEAKRTPGRQQCFYCLGKKQGICPEYLHQHAN